VFFEVQVFLAAGGYSERPPRALLHATASGCAARMMNLMPALPSCHPARATVLFPWPWICCTAGTAERRDFADQLEALKFRLHPLTNMPGLSELYGQFQAESMPAKRAEHAHKIDAMEAGVDATAHAAVFQDVDRVVAEVCRWQSFLLNNTDPCSASVPLAVASQVFWQHLPMLHASESLCDCDCDCHCDCHCYCACVCATRVQLVAQVAIPQKSSRAERSISRDAVFTTNAGKLKVEGAKTDAHGNVAGDEGDLGKKGAFKGLKVVVILQYSFDFSNPRRALEVRGAGHCLFFVRALESHFIICFLIITWRL
jgi:hypothetical protein